MDLLPVGNDCEYGKTTEGKAPSVFTFRWSLIREWPGSRFYCCI